MRVCVLNRQDVCLAGCLGSIRIEPDAFKSHTEVNNS